ncbi:ABC transporter permease subunit [Opitutaceae bacterium]|nr:ABC transporter permease subunit [Opitutaceae bacterium]
MFRFIARRLLETIPVLLIIITATFFMIRFVPGGPFTSEKAVSPEIKANLEAHYGLDKPLYQQYFDYLNSLRPKFSNTADLFRALSPVAMWQDRDAKPKQSRFYKNFYEPIFVDWDLKRSIGSDFGPSFKYPNRTVNEIISSKLPVSLELGLTSLVVALAFGITLGVIAAIKRNTWLDYFSSAIAMTGICIPTFVLGPLLVLFFAIYLGWFNASGWYTSYDRVLPAATLGLVYSAYVARLTRGGMLEILNQDYIRTARAKGASEFRVIFRHALKGGLLPVVSFLGPAIAGILTGSFVIETIFQIPGLGREFVNSAFNRDYTLVLGTVILYASLIIVLNLVVDVVQVWLNPKLKFD